MAESQREAISLALNSTKLNATNSLFREDPSLVLKQATVDNFPVGVRWISGLI